MADEGGGERELELRPSWSTWPYAEPWGIAARPRPRVQLEQPKPTSRPTTAIIPRVHHLEQHTSRSAFRAARGVWAVATAASVGRGLRTSAAHRASAVDANIGFVA